MISLTALALATLVALPQQATDTTVALDGATLLRLDNAGGSVVVSTWDQPTMRIQAQHSTRTSVTVRRRGAAVTIEAEARRGPATIVDYRLTVPAALDLNIEGQYSDVTIEGANGAVEVSTMEGDIVIKGGRGTVKASSTTGTILVDGAQGRVDVEAIGQGVRIVNATGEIYVESVGGSITMENVRARVVEAGNVGGGIRFSGPLASDGSYFFGTHGGTITLTLPANTAGTFNLASIHGPIVTDLPGAPARFERGQRHTFTVGGGGATVEAESFGGRISITRAAP